MNRAEKRRLKRDRSNAKKQASKKRSKLINKISLIIGILLLFIVAYFYSNRTIPKNNEVRVPIMKSLHVNNTDNFKYNSNPPTSGSHFGKWNRKWRLYDSELPTGGLIHNMEHGGVVIFFKPDLDQEVKNQLKKFTEDNFKIIAAVNTDIKAPIAMAAWGVYELFDTFDESAMKRFYKKNLDRSPEAVYP